MQLIRNGNRDCVDVSKQVIECGVSADTSWRCTARNGADDIRSRRTQVPKMVSGDVSESDGADRKLCLTGRHEALLYSSTI